MRFTSSGSCSCGAKYNEHTTIFENMEDRKRLGKTYDVKF